MSERDSSSAIEENPPAWKPVVGYVGLYEVSSGGRVRSAKTGNELADWPHGPRGYRRVCLFDGSKKFYYVHLLVAAAFLRQPLDDEQIRHKDGNTSRNGTDNIEWGTQEENEADKKRHGRVPTGLKNGAARFTDEQIAEICGCPSSELKSRRLAIGMSESYAYAIRSKKWRA